MLLTLAIYAFAAMVLLWTFIPVLRHEAWWIRMFEFPRVQICVLALCGLLATGLLFDPKSTTALLCGSVFVFCAGFQLWHIWPYTRLHPAQVKQAASRNPAAEISILVGNVLLPNRQSQKFLDIVERKDPDLVLTLETDDRWEGELSVLEGRYAYTVKHPLDNLYGMHLYSKLKLHDTKLLFLVEEGVPSIHTDVELRSGRKIKLHCLHPAPPSPTENETSLERDAELLAVAETFDATQQSVIVAGDLNDVAWSATTRLFHRTSQLLDPRIGRGMFNTFHAKLPFLRWPLDHVFHSADFELVSLERLPAFGSDHFPFFAALQLRPAPPAAHEIPEATADEKAQATEKIDKADVDEAAVQALHGGS